MLKNISEYFKNFKDDRVADIDDYIANNNEEIKDAMNRANTLQRRLIDTLSGAPRKDFNDYTCVALELYSLALDIAYEQGFKDGLDLASIADKPLRKSLAQHE